MSASKIPKESIDYKKWDEDPNDIANKEIRVLEPKQLSLAADLKSATEKFFQHVQISIKLRKDKNLNANNDDKILLNLSKDPSILITKPDKGRGVVILDHPTISCENPLTTVLRQMKNEEYLTQQEYKYIKPVGSVPARLYGLPNVHKDNESLRRIVSCIKSYNYKLGKFLANIIKPIRDSPYSLKNTNNFFKFIQQNSHLSKNNKMISFDIQSLFINIPVRETIEIICNKLYCTDPKLRLFIPEDYFRKLLEFATT
ncbi:unnamed protein product, partial [Rotaria sordida]